MNMDDYQDQSGKTAIFPKEEALTYLILGVCSEAGELAGPLHQPIRDNNGHVSMEKTIELIEENGDCLWYVAQIATALGSSLSYTGKLNLDKLNSRLERGVLGGSGDNR